MVKKLLNKLKGVYKGGLFHIFGSNVIANVCHLLSSVLVVRFLPKLQYGNYVSANNLYSYLTVFIGMGFANAIIQYCSERISLQQKNSVYRYTFVNGFIFNFILTVIMLVVSLLKLHSGNADTAKYLILMCGYPFTSYVLTFFQSVLRIKLKNKEYAKVNMVSTVTQLVGNIAFTYFFGVEGFIVSCYIAQIISVCAAGVFLKKEGFFAEVKSCSEKLSRSYRIGIARYAFVTAVTNFSSNILVLLDVTCLDLIFSDSVILADYHVAAVIPNACLFIPSGLIIYYYPQMVDARSSGWIEFKKYTKKLAKIFAGVSFVVTVIGFVFAPLAIKMVYGEKYMSAVPIMRVLMLNYFATSSLRKLLGNIIAVLKRVEINLINSVLSGLVNIVLNIVLIKWIGVIGAALSTLIVTVFITLLELSFLYRENKKQTKEANTI